MGDNEKRPIKPKNVIIMNRAHAPISMIICGKRTYLGPKEKTQVPIQELTPEIRQKFRKGQIRVLGMELSEAMKIFETKE